MRYADIIPILLNEIKKTPWGNEIQRDPTRYARWSHYNIYTIPWRSFEILDIFSKQTGHTTLSGLYVLDLGCGFATMDLFFILEGMAKFVIGVDLDFSAISVMNQILHKLKIENLRIVQGDIAYLPVAEESLDFVLSYDSFYYPNIPHKKVLKQVYYSLRSGGTLIIKVFNRLFPLYTLLALPGIEYAASRVLKRKEKIAGRNIGIIQPSAPTSIGLVKLLQKQGFVNVNLYDRIARSPSGWLRWFLPDVIIAATRP
jgi:SAM-dependent methyltransferase